jgi:hypothetical protein
MNSDYYYNNISLSEILHTTDTSSSYYKNMSKEDVKINPLISAFPFGYNLPTSSFPYSDDNSYREATYTDYTDYVGQIVTPPTWATRFSAILIGQGGQGGGGGGGYYQIKDGYKPYYSGTHGQNGTAGKAVVIPNTKITDEIQITVTGTNAFSNNKGATGAQNRNVSNALGTSGTAGVNGLSTTLTHDGTTYTGSGGTGGAGGTRWAGSGWPFNITYVPINPSPYPSPASFTSFNSNNGYTAVNIDWWLGTGGYGGNGGYGDGGEVAPATIGNPENGTDGYAGICRIYWKGN